MWLKVFLFLLFCWKGYGLPDSLLSLVIAPDESVNIRESRAAPNTEPKITRIDIVTNVANRFATTLMRSTVHNSETTSAQTTFSVNVPEKAFISGFEMTIGTGVYKAQVKEKSEAKQIYDDAVSQGLSAGHVEISARNSKTFDISVNIKPKSTIKFCLKYEELLERKHGSYELAIDIRPGQIVDDLDVTVFIAENRPLQFVRAPAFRTGNQITSNKTPNPTARITHIKRSSSAKVTFHPNVKQQEKIINQFGGSERNGIAGQFIVEYDVERISNAGEILVHDGYFVHFFAPSQQTPLKKYVVFALDHSGSMAGRKLGQLTEAMQKILPQLSPNDMFDLVRFHSGVSVWNVKSQKFETVSLGSSPDWSNLGRKLQTQQLPNTVRATAKNIEKATNSLKNHSHLGATNMIAGLDTALFLIDRTEKMFPNKYQLIMVFLTDGLPYTGLENTDNIIEIVTTINKREHKASIFALSFGKNADKQFLRKLAGQNFGFSRHIYTASDAALQLQDFYQTISLPLLKNVNFIYVDEVTNVAKTYSRILFDGSEIITTGRTSRNGNILLNVNAQAHNGAVQFTAQKTNSVNSLERLWAYLTIQQLLDEDLTQEALNLSLKYSFVTPVTSLVVVHDNLFLQTVTDNLPLAIDKREQKGSDDSNDETVLHQTASRLLQIPSWIEDIQGIDGIIPTPDGDLKLDPEQHATTNIACDNSPSDFDGMCINVFDCPKVYYALTSLTKYLDYSCTVNDEFAGVCCPT